MIQDRKGRAGQFPPVRLRKQMNDLGFYVQSGQAKIIQIFNMRHISIQMGVLEWRWSPSSDKIIHYNRERHGYHYHLGLPVIVIDTKVACFFHGHSCHSNRQCNNTG